MLAFILVQLLLVSDSGWCAGHALELSRFSFAQVRMGTRASVSVYAPDERTATEACRAAFKRIAELEDLLSDYRPRSELSRLSAQSGGPRVALSQELFDLLSRATDLSRRTDGAVDVTVGPYVALWRRARKTGRFPSAVELAAARQRVGWTKLRLDPARRTAQLAVPGMRLDVGGVAKGFAAQQAVNVLRAHGLPRALVDLGGDIAVGDPPPGREGWRVRLFDDSTQGTLLVVENVVVCASGDTEQYVELGGKHYSHIVDPRTGVGVTSRTMAAVVAPDGLLADGLATAVCVLGEERGRAIAAQYEGVRVWTRVVVDPVDGLDCAGRAQRAPRGPDLPDW